MPTSEAARSVVSGALGKPYRTLSSTESDTWVTRPSAAAPVARASANRRPRAVSFGARPGSNVATICCLSALGASFTIPCTVLAKSPASTISPRRECDLADDERGAQSRVAKATALGALFELAGRRAAEHDPRGHQPGRQGDPERERDREEHDAPVDADEHRHQDLHPFEGQKDEPDREADGDERSRERLEGQQAHELGAGRPERQPDGELARLFRRRGPGAGRPRSRSRSRAR